MRVVLKRLHSIVYEQVYKKNTVCYQLVSDTCKGDGMFWVLITSATVSLSYYWINIFEPFSFLCLEICTTEFVL